MYMYVVLKDIQTYANIELCSKEKLLIKKCLGFLLPACKIEMRLQ